MTAQQNRHIIAIGGYSSEPAENKRLFKYCLRHTGKKQPNILYLPTAQGDSSKFIEWQEQNFEGIGLLEPLYFFPWPPAHFRDLVLSKDAVLVEGGNTANMLAIWRSHGLDKVLREAWEAGIVLFGASAGMICWFEAGVTDSFGPQLEGMKDGLGFIKGSACPHYDAELRRRPRYEKLIKEGFPAGVAIDDGVAIHYQDSTIDEIISVRRDSKAYEVTPKGTTPLEVKYLTR